MRLLFLVLLLVTACARPSPRLPATDLVDLAALDPTIRLDIRYATADNFTGVALYPAARCLLRRDAAERLARVQRGLRAQGFGLLVWDCYRPFTLQERFWTLVPDERYVARPLRSDGRPVAGSKHSRGAAVDVTLVDVTGTPVEMPSAFDDFSERAHRNAAGVSPSARANARQLEAAMVSEGFEPLPTEWWHFDAPGWQTYDLLDVPLEN